MNRHKKLILFIVMIIFLYSCQTNIFEAGFNKKHTYGKLIERLIMTNEIYSFFDTTAVFSITLPRNYQKNWLQISKGNYDYPSGDIVYYCYKNNAEVFFSTSYMSINSDNINSDVEDSLVLSRFIDPIYYIRNRMNPPCIVLEGIDTNGLYWKDVRFEWVCYGYQNIRNEDKAIFDSIINSVKRIK